MTPGFPRDAACIVGIGHSAYGKRGAFAGAGLPRLALDAIHDACADAGLEARDIDGFTGYCDDVTAPSDLAVSLGTSELRYTALVWGGRGSGLPGAVANAYAAVATGLADYVVVVRSLIQTSRLGQSMAAGVGPGDAIPLGRPCLGVGSLSAVSGAITPVTADKSVGAGGRRGRGRSARRNRACRGRCKRCATAPIGQRDTAITGVLRAIRGDRAASGPRSRVRRR